MDQARLKYRIVGGIVLVSLLAILVPVLNDLRQPLPLGPQAIDIPAEPTEGVARDLPDGPPLEGALPVPQEIPPPIAPPPRSEDGGSVPPSPDSADLAPPAPEPAPVAQPKPAVSVARPEPASPPRAPSPAAKPAPKSTATPLAKPAPVPALKPTLLAKPAPIPAAKPPVSSTPSATVGPAAAATGQQAWVVQLGVFGNLKTAVDLREQLRKAGHSAFTEEVTTPYGKALRVRVGPELDRSVSQALRDRLARETGNDGIVVPYP